MIDIKIIIENLKTCERQKAYDGDEFIIIDGKIYLVKLLEELAREHTRKNSPKATGGKLLAIMKELDRKPTADNPIDQAKKRLREKRDVDNQE